MDRLRFMFLIDELEPAGEEAGVRALSSGGEIVLVDPLHRHFEGRLFRGLHDLQAQLERDLHARPGEAFFPVDVALVDYNLTASLNNSDEAPLGEEDQETLYNLPVAKHPIDVNSAIAERVNPVIALGPTMTVNFDGLIGAGIVAALFREHPIGVVPTTAYDTLLKGHRSVEELEGLLTRLFGVQFGNRGTLERDYHVLLAQGVVQFRRSLIELVRRRQVELDLATTTDLILDERPGSVRVSSLYVTRDIGYDALFFDSPEDATSVARSWAKAVSDAIFSEPRHRTSFHLAFGIAEKYWDAYRTREWIERQELAFLAKQYFDQEMWRSKKALHRQRFRMLLEKFHVDRHRLRAWKHILLLGDAHAKAGHPEGSWSEQERQRFSRYGETLGLTPDWHAEEHMPFGPKLFSEMLPGVGVTWEFTDLKTAPEPVAWLAMWMLALRLQIFVKQVCDRVTRGGSDEQKRLGEFLAALDERDILLLINPFPCGTIFSTEYGSPPGRRFIKRDFLLTTLGGTRKNLRFPPPRPNARERYWLRVFARQLGIAREDLPQWVREDIARGDDDWPFRKQVKRRPRARRPAIITTSDSRRQSRTAEELVDQLVEQATAQDFGHEPNDYIPFSLIYENLRETDDEFQAAALRLMEGRKLKAGPVWRPPDWVQDTWLLQGVRSLGELREKLLDENRELIVRLSRPHVEALQNDLLDERMGYFAVEVVEHMVRDIVSDCLRAWMGRRRRKEEPVASWYWYAESVTKKRLHNRNSIMIPLVRLHQAVFSASERPADFETDGMAESSFLTPPLRRWAQLQRYAPMGMR